MIHPDHDHSLFICLLTFCIARHLSKMRFNRPDFTQATSMPPKTMPPKIDRQKRLHHGNTKQAVTGPVKRPINMAFFPGSVSKQFFSLPHLMDSHATESRVPSPRPQAFAVADIHAEMKRLHDQGFQLLNSEPKRGADNKLVCFLHAKSTNSILIEICQDIDLPTKNQ